MKILKVKLTFTEDALGISPNDKEIYARYIASNAPDAKSKKEEIEAVGQQEYMERIMTVFPRSEDGNPMFWNYQLKGFFKDACGSLQRMKGEEESKHSCALRAYKKVIDGCIFVKPRQVKINVFDNQIGSLERTLRASTAQGERIALAVSETVKEGSSLAFKIIIKGDYEDVVREWLNYGEWKGLGAWRNAGYGTFKWEEIA